MLAVSYVGARLRNEHPGPLGTVPALVTTTERPQHAAVSDDATPPSTGIERLAVCVVVVVAVVARFVASSPLWLDEALSVNIASLPAGEIADALRRDGHPPLYYWLLSGWMDLVGSGDVAVRALSGLFGVAALPLAYVAGRRRGGERTGLAVLLVVAVMPWSIRYGSETRMYALVFLLVLAAWLLADDLLVRPSRWRAAALAAVTAAGVLSHYWVLYVGIAAVAALGWRWYRGDDEARRGSLRVAVSLAVGAVAFVPWLDSFLYQAEHTGTPWAGPLRPTQVVAELAGGMGGGGFAEAVLTGWLLLGLVMIGVVGVRAGQELVLRPSLQSVPSEAWVAGGVVAVGTVVGYLSGSTFVARYAAAFLPLVAIVAGVGLARIPSTRARAVVAVALVGLSMASWAKIATDDRTQGEQVAAVINAGGADGDVVVVCPDQLGPASSRSLDDRFDAVTVPALTPPERVDWVDYEERNAAADPVAVARAVLDRAGGAGIWVVLSPGYATYGTLCEAVLGELGAARGGVEVLVTNDSTVFEPMSLYRVAGAG